jgi:ComF family protein
MRTGLVEVVYPKTCAGCGRRGTWLCERCEAAVRRLDHGICYRCGSPVQDMCLSCAQLDPAISLARAAYPYTGWVPAAVKGFKYGDEWDRGPDLAERMIPLLPTFGAVDVVVPVPLHPAKERARGYNQSQILARDLAAALGVSCEPVVVRTRATLAQAALGRDERRENVQGAFGLNPDIAMASGLHYLLVDDVRTTGATLNACAQALTGLVPARISAFSFALDLPPRELRSWLAES